MKNEERYARRLRQTLDQGLPEIPQSAARRLEAARHLALARQRKTAPAMVLAGQAGNFSFSHPTPFMKQLLAVLALLIGMYISFYWQSHQYISELEEVDSALLADDLPPEAFLDKGFSAWLSNDSSKE